MESAKKMTINEAMKIYKKFSQMNNPSEEDVFRYTEAMEFLISETKNPEYMMNLGGYYYEIRKFDLALKYYEMAESYDYAPAYECLGYIWYYGRTGERDYKKAFTYYSKAAEKGNLVCEYKLADMYKNGYYVPKDYEKYKSIIESLYPKIKDTEQLFDPLPEIFTRLARIRAEEGRNEDAIELYLTAKDFLAQRIHYNAYFGNLNIMKWLIQDLYKLIDFDSEEFDFFDLYYVLQSPAKLTFDYSGKTHTVESSMENNECVICFDGKWFRNIDDFFQKACIGGDKLTAVADDLYDFEVI